jgi:hypothetical protein
MATIPVDDLEFPRPETPTSRAARLARDKASAAERAKRWRDEARASAALDAAIVAGVGRAFGLGHFVRGGEAGKGEAAVSLRVIVDQTAKAFRNAGGDYDEGARMAGARLQALIANPPRRT